MAHVICRIEKVSKGSKGSLPMRVRHNHRIGNSEELPKNIDQERMSENVYGGRCTTYEDHAKARDELVAQSEKLTGRKVRSDACTVDEVLLSVSPGFFDSWEKKDVCDFYGKQFKALQDMMGEGAILSTAIHFDEKTPHAHVLLTPVTKDGKVSHEELFGNGGWKKDQEGNVLKDKKGQRVPVFKRGEALRNLQTLMHEVVKEHGIDRGLVGSKAKHAPLSALRAAAALDDDEMRKRGREMLSGHEYKDLLKPIAIKKNLFHTQYEDTGQVRDRVDNALLMRAASHPKTLNEAQDLKRAERDKAKMGKALEQSQRDLGRIKRENASLIEERELLFDGLGEDDKIDLLMKANELREKAKEREKARLVKKAEERMVKKAENAKFRTRDRDGGIEL